jgi:hypothetical protein
MENTARRVSRRLSTVFVVVALGGLVAAGSATAAPPSGNTPVRLGGHRTQIAAVVAGGSRWLSSRPAQIADNQILLAWYRRDPRLNPITAAAAINRLGAGVRAAPITYGFTQNNGVFAAKLNDINKDEPKIDVELACPKPHPRPSDTPALAVHSSAAACDQAAEGAFNQALADVDEQALTDMYGEVPGENFDANLKEEPVPSSFLAPEVLEQSAQEAEQNPEFAGAWNDLWRGEEQEGIADSVSQLRKENPNLANNPDLDNQMQALHESSSDGSIDTTWGTLQGQYTGELSNVEGNSANAGQELESLVAGDSTVAKVNSELATDASDLTSEETTLSFDQSLVGLSGEESVAEVGTMDVADVAVEDVANVAVEDAVDDAVDSSLTGIDPLMIMQLVSQAPTDIMSLINALSGTPSPDAIIIQQLQVIEKMITGLSTQISSGFASVDAGLQQIDTTLETDTKLLTEANANLDAIREDMTQVQYQLDAIEADLFEIAKTQRDETLEETVSTDIGYSTRAPGGAAMPVALFEQAAGTFYDWAFLFPFDAISEVPSSNWSFDPNQVYGQLSNPQDSGGLGATDAGYVLDASLDYLGQYADSSWGQSISANLPNPDVWAAGAQAFAQLLFENPKDVTPALLTELRQIENVGTQVKSALSQLSADGGAISGVDALSFNTGSGVLNHALANYLEQGVTNSGSLTNELEGEENGFLSGQNPGGTSDTSGNCTPCALGATPSDGNQGAAYINLWGGPSQPPNGNLAKFQSTTDPNQTGTDSKAIPGEVNACGGQTNPAAVHIDSGNSALIDPLPSVYANAWHLGLGKITSTCYQASYENFDPFAETANLVVRIEWCWQVCSTPALWVSIETPDQRVCSGLPTADQELQEDWSVSDADFASDCSALNGYTLEPVLEGVVAQIATLTPPFATNPLKPPPAGAPCHTPPTGTIGCLYTGADPAPVSQSVASTLSSLQTQVYETIAPSGGQLTPNNDVANAATRLNGARSLLDDYIELGLPNSLSEDPTLRSLVYGPDHLLDNNPTDNEIYNDYQSWIASPPATDPAAPGGALEQTMKSDASALAGQLTTDIAAAANSPDGETDPLISSTIPWLELTYSVLTAPKPKPAPPPPALKILKAARAGAEKITVRFECLKATCKGAATASTTAHVKTRTVVATHGYTLRPSQTLAVTLSPNATGAKLLSRYGKLNVAFTLTLAEPGGKTATVEHASFVLKAPTPKPKR